MGTSWISRKGRIIEKGGMNPLTNYGHVKVELYLFNSYLGIWAIWENWAQILLTDMPGRTKNNPKFLVPHFTSNEAFLFCLDHLRIELYLWLK